MNKRKASVILSWLLLLFFAAGQIIIYAHQHHTKSNTLIVHSHDTAGQQIVYEKCNLCDQMHHAPINLVQPLNYTYLVSPVVRLYIPACHHYKANTLIHADGLSPPALV
ncbi:hypothetical protein [uncultured Mucilaginibacter sp.]|uniref:hypothetical protein n=1 Tax=uncultured Mucilaginibacter sp. TaxID=797541 RepID=UPI002634B7D3|nr:hypothetical protein [uncultured Mucilaginibacter sp.]